MYNFEFNTVEYCLSLYVEYIYCTISSYTMPLCYMIKLVSCTVHLEKRQAGDVGISRDIPVQVSCNGIVSQDNLGY